MKSALYYNIRRRCNYSQSMAANELGVSRQIFSNWENGIKTIPTARKAELGRLFGVSEEVLDIHDEATLLSFCDRPMYSRTCCGRQVFSFSPQNKHPRIFLDAPQESRPEEQCKKLMQRKNDLLEEIDRILRFDPGQQAEQLPNMEVAIYTLDAFGILMRRMHELEPKYRSRLLHFLQEQLDILIAVFCGETDMHYNEWQMQQIHLMRCR